MIELLGNIEKNNFVKIKNHFENKAKFIAILDLKTLCPLSNLFNEIIIKLCKLFQKEQS